MTLEQINARLAEIRSLLDGNDQNIDIDALTTEAEGLIAQRTALQNAETRRRELRARIAAGEGEVIRTGIGVPAAPQGEQRGADSIEYRNAWLRNLARDNQGNMLLGPMTDAERRAFVFTTENTGSVVPTMVLDRIAELVRASAPLLADSTLTNFSRGFGVPRHKQTKAGDAKVTAEGVANEDEEDVFDLLGLDGEEIKKHITMSKKMQIQSIEAFFTWVTTHLAERIKAAKERLIIERLDDVEVGMADTQKISGGTLTDALVRKAFSLIKAGGAKSVYANNATIWNQIAAATDGDDKKLFIPNSMSDPVITGRLYGAPVKEDTELADGKILIGVPRYLLTNDFDDLEIVPAVEPKTLLRIITGYSLFDAGLEHPEAFVEITLTGAAPAAAATE